MTRKRTTRVDVSELLCQSSDKQPGLRWPELSMGWWTGLSMQRMLRVRTRVGESSWLP